MSDLLDRRRLNYLSAIYYKYLSRRCRLQALSLKATAKNETTGRKSS